MPLRTQHQHPNIGSDTKNPNHEYPVNLSQPDYKDQKQKQQVIFFYSWKMGKEGAGGGGKEEEQDGMSVHSPCKARPSSSSSLSKEQSQVELELRLLQALEIYPPSKLKGIHRHFVLFGLMELLRKSFGRQFSSEEVLQLLERFYNLEMVKPDDEDNEILNHEEEFSLPKSYFVKDES